MTYKCLKRTHNSVRAPPQPLHSSSDFLCHILWILVFHTYNGVTVFQPWWMRIRGLANFSFALFFSQPLRTCLALKLKCRMNAGDILLKNAYNPGNSMWWSEISPNDGWGNVWTEFETTARRQSPVLICCNSPSTRWLFFSSLPFSISVASFLFISSQLCRYLLLTWYVWKFVAYNLLPFDIRLCWEGRRLPKLAEPLALNNIITGIYSLASGPLVSHSTETFLGHFTFYYY